MRGIKSKQARRARERDVKALERAVNENHDAAVALYAAYTGEMWQRFWANVEIAALCTFMQNRFVADDVIYNNGVAPLVLAKLEKAIHFWPANVEI
jgi:hypothetical protein